MKLRVIGINVGVLLIVGSIGTASAQRRAASTETYAFKPGQRLSMLLDTNNIRTLRFTATFVGVRACGNYFTITNGTIKNICLDRKTFDITAYRISGLGSYSGSNQAVGGLMARGPNSKWKVNYRWAGKRIIGNCESGPVAGGRYTITCNETGAKVSIVVDASKGVWLERKKTRSGSRYSIMKIVGGL